MSAETNTHPPAAFTVAKPSQKGWFAAGGCLAAAAVSCLTAGLLAAAGWLFFDGRIVRALLPLDQIPFLAGLLEAVQGERSQLLILERKELAGEDLQAAAVQFGERDPGFSTLLSWALIGEGKAEELAPVSGTWMLLTDEQEIVALLYQSTDNRILTIQSWMPDSPGAVTFFSELQPGAVDPTLWLRTLDGTIQVHAGGWEDVTGATGEEPDGTTGEAALESDQSSSGPSRETGSCETGDWQDYQACLGDLELQWNYKPDIDCVPDLNALQRVWDVDAATVPGAALRSLIQCGSPAVNCIPAAVDNPPTAVLLHAPVLLEEGSWESCRDDQSLWVEPIYEITVFWTDDRLPFERAGDQVYQFPASGYLISEQDCGGQAAVLEGGMPDELQREVLACGAAEYCLETNPGSAVCAPAVPTAVPSQEGDQGTADPTASQEVPGEQVTADGTIQRRSGACVILDGICSIEQNALTLTYRENGAAAGSAVYQESYPSGDCGPNLAQYSFSFSGTMEPEGVLALDWQVERVITLQAGARGFCRGTSTILADSGSTLAEPDGASGYEGILVMENGESFRYRIVP